MNDIDYLIIGAGLAGLSCARTLADAGKRVTVLERSAKVGGRCAHRSPGTGPVVDFGPVFVHGDDRAFLSWIESFSDDLIAGWPRVVEGSGAPCQPQAFDPRQRRYALRPGIRRLAESLADGLDVVPGVMVESLVWKRDGIEANGEGRRFSAKQGVVAAALEQSRGLLSALGGGPGGEEVSRLDALLAQFASASCLAILAEYGPDVEPPPWDVRYPEASRAVLLVSNEQTKRGSGQAAVRLAIQARPGWSAARLEADRDAWSRELLGEAAALLGDWAARPVAFRPHRWKYARLAASDHLVSPVLLERPGSSACWGVAGDLFDSDGGLQGAWRSGRRLAERLLQQKG